jgi:hypothetical protein
MKEENNSWTASVKLPRRKEEREMRKKIINPSQVCVGGGLGLPCNPTYLGGGDRRISVQGWPGQKKKKRTYLKNN